MGEIPVVCKDWLARRAMPFCAKTGWSTAWQREFGFSDRLLAALRSANSRLIVALRPATASDSNAAETVIDHHNVPPFPFIYGKLKSAYKNMQNQPRN
jgi:hypothetical protein